jgi:hypothetical protein
MQPVKNVPLKVPTQPSSPPPEWVQKKAALNKMIDVVGGDLKGFGWSGLVWSCLVGLVWSGLVWSGMVWSYLASSVFGFLCLTGHGRTRSTVRQDNINNDKTPEPQEVSE